MPVIPTNDVTFAEILAQANAEADTFPLLQKIVNDGLVPPELTSAEFFGQLCQAAIKAQEVKNQTENLANPNRVAAYLANGLGTVREDNNGNRYVQESYTVLVRNYIEHQLTAENN